MNLLFFLTPKVSCSHLESDESLREAIERMNLAGYTSLPIIDKEGRYLGTMAEGDLLRGLVRICGGDLKQAELTNIMELPRRRDYAPVRVSEDTESLLNKALDQNFVPVVDDRDTFIGIVTRTTMMQYFLRELEDPVQPAAVG